MWREQLEDEQLWYINDDIGSIYQTSNGQFVAMVPKVVKLGPFNTIEEAKQVAEDKEGLERVLDQYNLQLVNFVTELKAYKK